ncbi:MAG: ATP-binding protein [Candidatus Tectomicrobia bacterium]
MNDADATKEQLMAENTALRQRVVVLQVAVIERQRAEEALRESEERYRALVEGSIQGISIVSREGKRLFANQALVTMLGYETLDAYLAHHALDNVAPHERNRLRGYREALFRGESVPTHYEYQGVRLDGMSLQLERVVTPMVWEGEPALLSTILDITERKQAEEERKRLEDWLRQSQKMEAIGTLAGGIAHEFNNVLMVMIGFTQMAIDDISPATPLYQNLQEVLTAGKRAKDLVRQILTFSRKSDHKRIPVPLPSLVHATLTLLRASLPTTIAIQQHIAPDAGTVLADPTQIHQILLNLCTNAEHAMREMGGILAIGLDHVEVDDAFAVSRPELQVGPHVRLTVRDTGHGMPPEVVERIFDPFFTTKGIGEGTGMGLAIVQGIVTSHGGAITVESRPGHGTTFAVYLPRITAAAESEVYPEMSLPHGTGCILFVDDEETLARLGQGMLQRLGYDVVARTSSTKALEAFRAMPERFDLVITDQTMPHMTGEMLVKELQRIRPDIPIILCTGFSHVMHAEKAQALGIEAFLMKPVIARDLAVTIQQVLAQHHGQDDTA